MSAKEFIQKEREREREEERGGESERKEARGKETKNVYNEKKRKR